MGGNTNYNMQKQIIALVVLVLVIVGLNFAVPFLSKTAVAPVTTTTDEVSMADSKTYKNDQYGFELKFPASWSNYQVQNTDNKGLSFGVSDQPRMFTLSVSTQADWANAQKAELNPAQYIAEKDGLVFSYIRSQDYVDSVLPLAKQITDIISTFKFTASPQVVNTDLYVIDVRSKSPVVLKDESIGELDEIKELLKIPVSVNNFGLVYNASKVSNPYIKPLKGEFYLSFPSGQLAVGKYENAKYDGTLAKANPKLAPYVSDSSYCEIKSDCQVRDHFCGYGAYNSYDPFINSGWGCEGRHYPQEDQNFLNQQCDVAISYPVVEYSGADCVSNRCVPTGRTITCQPGQLP